MASGVYKFVLQIFRWLCFYSSVSYVSTESIIAFAEDCQWNYSLKNAYNDLISNVTIQEVSEGCDAPFRGDKVFKQAFDVKLTVKEDDVRRLDLKWDYSDCYSVIYMEFEASFPALSVDRKCLKVESHQISETERYREGLLMEFGCLCLPPVVIGTLTVRTSRLAATGVSCSPTRDFHTRRFNLGCPNDRVEVRFIDKCLGLEFLHLHAGIDYKRTIIYVNNSLAADGTDIQRFVPDEGIIDLQVRKSGIYVIQIKIVCNAFGEIKERKISLTKTVTNATACLASNPSTTGMRTIDESSQPDRARMHLDESSQPDRARLHLVIAVVSIVSMLCVTVTILFCLGRHQDCWTEYLSSCGIETTTASNNTNNVQIHESEPLSDQTDKESQLTVGKQLTDWRFEFQKANMQC